MFPGVVDGSLRPGMGATREAEVLAMGLADDDAAGIENAGDHRCIDFRRVAFHDR